MSDGPLYVGPLLHLRTLPAFEALTHAQLRDLAYEAQEVVLPRGSTLLHRGQPGAAMYLIVDGFVRTGEGEPVGPGGVVGFWDVLTPGPAPTAALAVTDVVALRVETDVLRDVCEQNFAVLSALLTYTARRVTENRDALVRSIVGRSLRAISDTGELDRVGRIVALHRAPAFPSHSMDALAELAGHMEEVRVEKGDSLWRVGDVATRFFLICSGRVRLAGNHLDQEVELGPGGVPGLVETLAGRRHGLEAHAAEPTILLQVGDEAFLDVIEDHFEMAFGLLGRLAAHLIESTSVGEAGIT